MRQLSFLAIVLLLFSATAGAEAFLSVLVDSQPLITTPLDPAGYVQVPSTVFDGVARLIISMPDGTYGCSGSLLAGGQYVLTAGHCISNGTAGASPTVNALSATFFTAGGPETYNGSAYYTPPDWSGSYLDGGDIALIRLATPVVGIAGYELYRGAELTLGMIDVAGYGLTGFGATGAVPGSFGTLRAGQNDLEGVHWNSIADGHSLAGLPYAWDFDNGLATNDALCILAGACNRGRSAAEVMIALGDSGGPSFFGGRLAGVHSFSATFGPPIDIDGALNSSFGELAGDTRVNYYAGWIDSVTVPEPGSMLLFGTGLVAWVAWGRRRRA